MGRHPPLRSLGVSTPLSQALGTLRKTYLIEEQRQQRQLKTCIPPPSTLTVVGIVWLPNGSYTRVCRRSTRIMQHSTFSADSANSLGTLSPTLRRAAGHESEWARNVDITCRSRSIPCVRTPVSHKHQETASG